MGLIDDGDNRNIQLRRVGDSDSDKKLTTIPYLQ